MAAQRMLGLLRGINVGGKRRVPMADLRQLAERGGLRDVQTFIQSGNLVFSATRSSEQVARALEKAIASHFGFDVPVVVRTESEWKRVLGRCPFPEAAETRPKLLHVCCSRDKPQKGAVEALSRLCSPSETVALVGNALWIDYQGGVARSKLSPAALDRALGSSVTARNVKTARALAELLAAEKRA